MSCYRRCKCTILDGHAIKCQCSTRPKITRLTHILQGWFRYPSHLHPSTFVYVKSHTTYGEQQRNTNHYSNATLYASYMQALKMFVAPYFASGRKDIQHDALGRPISISRAKISLTIPPISKENLHPVPGSFSTSCGRYRLTLPCAASLLEHPLPPFLLTPETVSAGIRLEKGWYYRDKDVLFRLYADGTKESYGRRTWGEAHWKPRKNW